MVSVSSKQEVVVRGSSVFLPGPGPRSPGMLGGGAWAGEPGREAAVKGKASDQPWWDWGSRCQVWSPVHLCACAAVAAKRGTDT